MGEYGDGGGGEVVEAKAGGYFLQGLADEWVVEVGFVDLGDGLTEEGVAIVAVDIPQAGSSGCFKACCHDAAAAAEVACCGGIGWQNWFGGGSPRWWLNCDGVWHHTYLLCFVSPVATRRFTL